MNQTTRITASPTLQRARGCAEVTVGTREGRTVLRRLYQQGCAKALLPRTHSAKPEAVIVNTSGGLTGGDRLDYRFEAEAGAGLTVTTQAAERVYRASAGEARVVTGLHLGAGADLAWLPQETILFEGGALRRTLDVEMAEGARLTAIESIVFGRAAMGETVTHGALNDQWRIRHEGRLIHAEALRATGDLARSMAGRATLRDTRAIATLVHVEAGAEDRLDEARGIIAQFEGTSAAATAKPGLLIARFAAPDAAPLRKALIRFLMAFRRETLPRVWSF
ncbi:urease accessory protein UreD [Amaricoccus macauensis]|uniref:urease accessory protein UreD n=1 Tax=Amaricoccus macauensis TaxID=57001 RepID=UPI003C7C80E4